MQRVVIIMFYIFGLLLPAFADLPGFVNSGVKTLRVLGQLNTVIQNGTEVVEEKNEWRHPCLTTAENYFRN